MNPLKTSCTMMRIKERVNARSHQLHGDLTLVRTTETRISRAMTQLQCMGLTNHTLVVITGKMTDYQRKRVKEKTTVRTEKLLDAVKWLVKNHRKWKNVDLSAMEKELEDIQPIVQDLSELVNSENSNIETEEVFTCYYPDSSINRTEGGYDGHETFKDFVEKMHQSGADIQFKLNLQTQFMNYDNEDQIVNSSLLQFSLRCWGTERKTVEHRQ
jgi:hypothetical protein